ncbi:WD40 repeat domain-containing protein [Streptomyces sp. NPDC012466]|uniref:WD40 repeat domain-containing protein n=1 Tax=Streptomyces sp. NPDC012466 TaxID=3364835 RepID=UPI0036ECDF86
MPLVRQRRTAHGRPSQLDRPEDHPAGQPTWQYPANCSKKDFQFTPDSRHLILRDPTGIRRWDIASGLELPKLEHEGLEDLEFSPDGRFLAAADLDEILLWRTDAPAAPVFRHPLPEETISDLRLDVEERRIRYFAGSSQTVVRSLSLDGVVDSRWRSQPAASASFSPDGGTLAIAHQDTDTGRTQIQLLDGRNSRHLAGPPSAACPTFPDGRQNPAPCPVHMAFRLDGRLLAYGVSHPTNSVPREKLFLWEVPAHRMTKSLTVTRTNPENPSLPANAVNGIACHPDGTSLMVSRMPEDERLEFWNLRTGNMTREPPASVAKPWRSDPPNASWRPTMTSSSTCLPDGSHAVLSPPA